MSDRVFLIGTVGLTIGMCTSLIAGAWWILSRLYRRLLDDKLQKSAPPAQLIWEDPGKRRLNVLMSAAQKASGPSACCKCQYWDHDAGQLVLMQNPVFAAVTKQLKPGHMCQRSAENDAGDDAGGAPQPADPNAFTPPEYLDTWDLFGLCNKHEECRHAMHKCEQFAAVQS